MIVKTIDITLYVIIGFYVIGLILTAIGIFHKENRFIPVWEKLFICAGWFVFFLVIAVLWLWKGVEDTFNRK